MRWLTLMAALVVICGVPTVAAANSDTDHQTPRPGGSVQGGVPEAVVVMGPGERPIAEGRTGGQGGTWTCHYYRQVGGELPDAAGVGDPVVPEAGQYVAFVCFDATGAIVHLDARYYEPADPFGGIGAAYRAMEVARERLVLEPPAIGLSPPAGSFQLVGLPTYLAVGDAWATVSETATVGAVSSTVTATPTQVEWDPGDGSAAVVCDGPGSVAEPDCTHTYGHSTRGAPITLTATITWEVAWTATTGEGGVLPGVTRTSSVDVVVQEAQAVIG